MARRNRRQEYINECNHDLEYFKKELNRHAELKKVGENYTIWFHGEKLSAYTVKENIKFLEQELKVLATNKEYKPYILRG